MRFSTILLLCLSAVPATVSACEGDCIVGITNAFVGNYSSHVHQVMNKVSSEIATMINSPKADDVSMQCLKPIMNAYAEEAYNGMELAIFPRFFHGKCLVNGVEPDGCPNPDCPVVCGTPGSLVHFYAQLRYIAYNQTRHLLKELATPGSQTYEQVQQNVLAANGKTRRSIRIYSRSEPNGTVSMLVTKREEDTKQKLEGIMNKFSDSLLESCGGSANGDTNGLPHCDWEDSMKPYILTFP